MEHPPKWYTPVAIAALLWNVVGCIAYLSDAMLSPEALANMSAADQALRAARPAWSVAATAIAVWGGAAGSVGLIMRRSWATPLLIASLIGVVVQDVSLFMLSGTAAEPGALALQGLVLLIAIGLVMLARKAMSRGWMAPSTKPTGS